MTTRAKAPATNGRRRVHATAETIAADLMAEADRLQMEALQTLSRARYMRKVARGLKARGVKL